jgi:hypothetical protein
MFKQLLIASVLSVSFVAAQGTVAPRAAELLEKAKTAHGGAALEGLKTYKETATLQYFAANGSVAAEIVGVSVVDFAGERLRLEIRQGNQIAQIQQVTPTEAWTWSTQTGVVRLPNTQAKPLRDALNQGWYGLRLGGKGRESASADGALSFADQKGEGVTVTTKGSKASYLFNANGVLIAEKTGVAQIGEVVTVYGGYRAVNGVQIPFEGVGYVGPAKFYAAKTSDAQVNPSLNDADFAQPK